MYKLMAVDLDGTLLSEDWQIPEHVKQCIREAEANGAYFTLATGRIYRSALRYARELAINVPIICSNGALIKHPQSGAVTAHITISPVMVREVIAWLAGKNIEFYGFIGDVVYTDRRTDFYDRYTAALGFPINIVPDFFTALTQDLTCLMLKVNEAELHELRMQLAEQFAGKLAFTCSTAFFIDVIGPGVSKGQGLAMLAKTLGVKQDEIIAIGDGHNDLPMIDYAGLGVVVGNAPADVKEHADYVTSGHRAEGVMEVIKKFMLC